MEDATMNEYPDGYEYSYVLLTRGAEHPRLRHRPFRSLEDARRNVRRCYPEGVESGWVATPEGEWHVHYERRPVCPWEPIEIGNDDATVKP